MKREEFIEHCFDKYGTSPDYPFDDDCETAVFRHSNNRKWYALAMRVSRRKFGLNSDEKTDVVNMKLPTELYGSFSASDGVYPAYHMNKYHWISVLINDASKELIEFLLNASYEATSGRPRSKQRNNK